jgi:hypothetical protein
MFLGSIALWVCAALALARCMTAAHSLSVRFRCLPVLTRSALFKNPTHAGTWGREGSGASSPRGRPLMSHSMCCGGVEGAWGWDVHSPCCFLSWCPPAIVLLPNWRGPSHFLLCGISHLQVVIGWPATAD